MKMLDGVNAIQNRAGYVIRITLTIKKCSDQRDELSMSRHTNSTGWRELRLMARFTDYLH